MKRQLKFMAMGLTMALAVTACGSSSDDEATSTSTTAMDHMTSTTAMTAAVNNAGDLRTRVNLLLGDHMVLASKATGAALGGRTDDFNAYATQLNTNGTDIGSLVGAAYGTDAQADFNKIWSAHNGFFVDYTTGVAKGDKAMTDKAVADLTNTYVPQFSDFIAKATGLPVDTVKSLTAEHVMTTKAVVDKQAAKDWPGAVAAERTAYMHMAMIADPLSDAIAKKFPTKFPASNVKATDLRVKLNIALQEHLYLASSATGAALGARSDEYAAYGKALNTNGTEIGSMIGSLYGTDAQADFNKIWSAHNGFFVDYTTGVAKGDKAMTDKAVADLTNTYVPQFSDFIAKATGLPVDTVKSLTAEHVMTTKAVVDKQAAKDSTGAAQADRSAAMHMQMIGDPLADAIVKKFPAKFAG